jgi:N-acetylmuramoyl-L-alanine amidase
MRARVLASQLVRHGASVVASALLVGLGASALAEPGVLSARAVPDSRFRVVVIDPGHGGPDFGGKSVAGVLEKDLVLKLAKRVGRALERQEVRVVYTRDSDRFVSLAERTEIANRADGDLFLSIHANTAPDPEAEGFETYFLSVEASDDEARRVALVENQVFDQPAAAADSADIVGGILSDMIRTQFLQDSSAIAASIQRGVAPLPGPSRGVKQAPFVVLMGVNMPAALLEVGFLTHEEEAHRLQSRQHQEAIARAVSAAVLKYGASRRSLPAAGEKP